jgi:hypothetical protein
VAGVSRAFFDQIDDELRGLLGPALRGYACARGPRLVKVWYSHPAVHFEVQAVGVRWSPLPVPALEVGLHLEHPEPAVNVRLLGVLQGSQGVWGKTLPAAAAGPGLGPRGTRWRRVSEFLPDDGSEDPDLASEAAEILAAYVRTLWPLMAGPAEQLGSPPAITGER